MSRTFRRSKAAGWFFLALAAFLAAISGTIVVGIGRYGLDQLMHPLIVLIVALPLAVALSLALTGRAYLRHQPVMVAIDAAGVSFSGGAAIAWDDIVAIIAEEVHVGYGPRERLILRRRFTPSDIAAKRAERRVHDLFTDKTIAPGSVESTLDDVLAAFDTAMAEAGFVRADPPVKRFGLIRSTTTWDIRPAGTGA